MKFALTALTSFALMEGLVVSMPQSSPLLTKSNALKADYQALTPQLEALGLLPWDSTWTKGVNLNKFFSLGASPLTQYNPVDIATLKANGYAHLAAHLENAAALGVEAGERGLLAIKKLIASDLSDLSLLTEAKLAAEGASDIGLKALAALPKSSSLKPGTIENLRALGLHNIADNLVEVQKGLLEGDDASAAIKQLAISSGDKDGLAKFRTYDQIRTEVYTPEVDAVPPPAPAVPVAPAVAPVAPVAGRGRARRPAAARGSYFDFAGWPHYN